MPNFKQDILDAAAGEPILAIAVSDHLTRRISMPAKKTIERLLAESKAKVETMTPGAREAMFRQQRESWMRAERGWPAARHQWIDGVKVYDSYEDYAND
jgi:uncharacterized small protein (DUF1192 family)